MHWHAQLMKMTDNTLALCSYRRTFTFIVSDEYSYRKSNYRLSNIIYNYSNDYIFKKKGLRSFL